jgi:hypothetical protein
VYARSAQDDFELEMEFKIEAAGYVFDFEFEFEHDSNGGRDLSVWVNTSDGYDSHYAHASVSASAQESVSLRVRHNVALRELLFEYQPAGATEWTELARLDLANGAFSGTNASSDGFRGELVSTSQRMVLDFGVESGYPTVSGDLRIGGIEIGSYTPPPTSIDSDDDGLDDSAETNTGVYVSATNTGTDPNNADSSGDGFTDGEAVAAGFDPNTDYSDLIAIVLNDSGRFEDDDATVDIQLRGLRLERDVNGSFKMNFDLELSTDLETWTPHTSHSLDLDVPDQSKEFMRLRVE